MRRDMLVHVKEAIIKNFQRAQINTKKPAEG